jgi:hypothetical protein
MFKSQLRRAEMKKLRPRLTYSNVISTLALFLALSGGVAFAASKVHSGDIANGAVKTSKLHQRAVSSGKLALGAVRSNQIADGAVSSTQIANGAVNSAQIANGAVSSAQIRAGSVAPSDLQVPLSFAANPTGGSVRVPTSGEPAPYPLGNNVWTQTPGEVNVTFGAAIATLAYDGSGSGSCRIFFEFGLRGELEGGESGGELSTSSTTPQQVEANLGAIPQIDPTTPTTRRLTARIRSNEDCTEASTLDSSRFRVVDFG